MDGSITGSATERNYDVCTEGKINDRLAALSPLLCEKTSKVQERTKRNEFSLPRRTEFIEKFYVDGFMLNWY